jgi:hypothetical protein
MAATIGAVMDDVTCKSSIAPCYVLFQSCTPWTSSDVTHKFRPWAWWEQSLISLAFEGNHMCICTDSIFVTAEYGKSANRWQWTLNKKKLKKNRNKKKNSQ